MDRKILAELQEDAGQSLSDEIARKVGSSKTPVWNRIRKLREAGDRPAAGHPRPRALGLEACFFASSSAPPSTRRTGNAGSSRRWKDRPEVLEAHRLAGDIDYRS